MPPTGKDSFCPSLFIQLVTSWASFPGLLRESEAAGRGECGPGYPSGHRSSGGTRHGCVRDVRCLSGILCWWETLSLWKEPLEPIQPQRTNKVGTTGTTGDDLSRQDGGVS